MSGRKPGDRWQKAARNAAIRAQFDGKNYAELARRWGLSKRMIRLIVDRPSPRK